MVCVCVVLYYDALLYYDAVLYYDVVLYYDAGNVFTSVYSVDVY